MLHSFLPPQPLATTILLSMSMNLMTLDTSHDWNHSILSFCDWLILLGKMSSEFSHVSEFYFIVHIYHILFIHSSEHGPLAGIHFWLLWIMLLWSCVNKYMFKFLLPVILGVYPEIEMLNHMVILCLIFRKYYTIFHNNWTIYIPTNNAQEFRFLSFSPILVFFFLSFFPPILVIFLLFKLLLKQCNIILISCTLALKPGSITYLLCEYRQII